MKTKSPLTLTIAAVGLFVVGIHPTIAGTFASTQSGSWNSAATWGGAGVPGCADTVTISGGTTVTEDASQCSGDLTVNGTLDMTNDFFFFEGTTFTNNGALISSTPYGEFRFNGVGGAGGTTQNLAGTGTYNTNGRVDFHTLFSTTVVPASGAVLNGLTNWTIDGGSVLSLSNNFVVNGLTGSGQTTFFNNSTISGSGILKTHNNVTINSGGIITALLEVVSGTTSASGGNSGNFGPITVDSGATLFESGNVAANGDLTVNGTLDMSNQYFFFGGTTFTNNGALISSAASGFGEFRFNSVGNNTNGGTTQNLAGTGTYNTNGRVDFHTLFSTTVVSATGALIEGVFNNTIDGGSTFNNHGTMAPGFPPGTANVSGNWQLGSTSNLAFGIEGTTPGTQYDVFNKTDGSALTLNGDLSVRLMNGFVPANSDVFTIVTTQQILAGSFSNVANGGRINTEDGAGSFRVTYNVLNDPIASSKVVLSDFQPINRCDTDPPGIGIAPANIEQPIRPQQKKVNGQKGAYVYFTVIANDLEDGPVPATANPPSGSFFPLGTTLVTVTATDHCNNTTTKTFTITVSNKKK